MKEEIKYYSRIEEMSDAELKKRIEHSMIVELTNKIKVVPYMGKIDEIISYTYPELIARCPMTGVMDLYTIEIEYTPNLFIPELKSLKLYLWNYDQIPISHEHLFARIWKDFTDTVQPKWCGIILSVAPRGQVVTKISYEKTF